MTVHTQMRRIFALSLRAVRGDFGRTADVVGDGLHRPCQTGRANAAQGSASKRSRSGHASATGAVRFAHDHR